MGQTVLQAKDVTPEPTLKKLKICDSNTGKAIGEVILLIYKYICIKLLQIIRLN